jgi:hypothetical protein
MTLPQPRQFTVRVSNTFPGSAARDTAGTAAAHSTRTSPHPASSGAARASRGRRDRSACRARRSRRSSGTLPAHWPATDGGTRRSLELPHCHAARRDHPGAVDTAPPSSGWYTQQPDTASAGGWGSWGTSLTTWAPPHPVSPLNARHPIGARAALLTEPGADGPAHGTAVRRWVFGDLGGTVPPTVGAFTNPARLLPFRQPPWLLGRSITRHHGISRRGP